MNLEKVDDFLTVKELSKWIKLSESHIYFLVNKRKIPFAKLGGKLLFDKQKIKDWIDENSPEPVEVIKEKLEVQEVLTIPDEQESLLIPEEKVIAIVDSNQLEELEKKLKEESNFEIQ